MTPPLRIRFLGLLVLAALIVHLPRPAAAQSAQDIERAKESFKAGATAYAAGEYLAAIQALDAAYALTPAPAIAFSLAQAERRQYFVGHERPHLDRAITLYRRYIDQIPSGGRRADALDALSQLEPLAATLAPIHPEPGPQVKGPAVEDRGAPRPTRVMITAEAPGAQLSLDGGTPVASPLIREVEAGRHHVDSTAAGYFSEGRDFTAVAGELIPVAVSLRERPSTVALTTSADAEIYVDGAFVRRGGDRVPLQLPSGAHRLNVAEKGHHLSLRTLTLGPGETQDISVALDPTWQRRAARVLFVGGGVALGAGIVFSVLAVGTEDRAQEFLRKQAAGNVSSGELSSYRGAVTDRDRYRMATAVSLVSAVTFLVTGLLLYEMDHPDPKELNRRAPSFEGDPVAKAEGPARPHVQLTPVLAAGGFSAVLGGTF